MVNFCSIVQYRILNRILQLPLSYILLIIYTDSGCEYKIIFQDIAHERIMLPPYRTRLSPFQLVFFLITVPVSMEGRNICMCLLFILCDMHNNYYLKT